MCQKIIRITGPEETHECRDDGYVDGIQCGQLADDCRSIPNTFKLCKMLCLEHIKVGRWKIIRIYFSKSWWKLACQNLQFLIHISYKIFSSYAFKICNNNYLETFTSMILISKSFVKYVFYCTLGYHLWHGLLAVSSFWRLHYVSVYYIDFIIIYLCLFLGSLF